MNEPIREQFLVSPFLAFFIVHSMQIGIGVLGFQRYVSEYAGHDAWISVLLAGLGINIIIWMMYKMLNKDKTDIVSIHETAFGKWIGGFFSFLFMMYLLFLGVMILRTFIEVIQVWMFPLLKTWPFTLVFLIAVYYVVTGGFRTVVGVCFLGVVVPFYLIFTFLAPLEFANFRNLLPVFDLSIKDMAKSIQTMTLSYLGFELLFIYYPFIKKPETSQKWFHFGNFFTTFLYLYLMIITLVFYTPDYLKKTIWPTLAMWKIFELPFVERFEFIGIASWAVVILPNICLTFWAASRVSKRLFHFKQKKALIVFLVVALIIGPLLKDRTTIDYVNTLLSRVGFYFIYVYIPFLFIIYHIMSKARKKA
ncbi:GerAB/ArcD/ProY family transporter [Bacillus sp. NEB1478]|uniref:GerAB/ArcD/ProY family transporter n=1 Tax=Bacillus sp. NEB1478 TaxID=3073816 RepID=UPI0028736F2D|nr:GerAB/ArcD/ProY family transporter [Bacillus sp. NEB1478]WNB93366.1 GerAB/ArcD/ProY family transporter [Bacillus sp. NEB1478]